jgi:hypothetical protein
VDAKLLEAIGATHFGLFEAVVVDRLIPYQRGNVPQAVELRANLTDLAAEHLLVRH